MEPWIDGLWSAIKDLNGLSVKENAPLTDFCETDNKENCISCENTIESSKTVTNMDKNDIGNKRSNLNVKDNRNGDTDREVAEDGQSNDYLDRNKWNSPSIELSGKGLIFYTYFLFYQSRNLAAFCLIDELTIFAQNCICSSK